MRRVLIVAALAAIVPAVVVPVAAAAPDERRQKAKVRFTTKAPGAPSGLVFRVDYVNPADPSGKPPAVTRVVETLARGARFDTSAPEACPASDAELMLLGTGACSPGSQVGTGHLTLDTGFPAPARTLDVEVDFFNNTGQFIFLNQVAALDIPRVVVRSAVGKRRIESGAPFLPGTPPDGAAIDTVAVRTPPIRRTVDGERRAYVTTPPRCPRRGFWVNRARFTYFDGVTQAVATRSPCRPGRGARR